jgi:hypothetical protein
MAIETSVLQCIFFVLGIITKLGNRVTCFDRTSHTVHSSFQLSSCWVSLRDSLTNSSLSLGVRLEHVCFLLSLECFSVDSVLSFFCVT